jgi:hypothetical protein
MAASFVELWNYGSYDSTVVSWVTVMSTCLSRVGSTCRSSETHDLPCLACDLSRCHPYNPQAPTYKALTLPGARET